MSLVVSEHHFHLRVLLLKEGALISVSSLFLVVPKEKLMKGVNDINKAILSIYNLVWTSENNNAISVKKKIEWMR